MARPNRRRERAEIVLQRLGDLFPGSATELCALVHDNPFQLLEATILSAQCTDERVNLVTPALFAAYPMPTDLAGADPAKVESIIRSTGFFRAKTANLIGMARGLVERFDGVVPETMEELVTLPGVGRKTANVILSVAFAKPGLPVDTHVGRLARRLGLTKETDPARFERDSRALVPAQDWGALSLRLILHGRATCTARQPRCGECVLADVCPSAGIGSAAPVRRAAKRARAVSAAG